MAGLSTPWIAGSPAVVVMSPIQPMMVEARRKIVGICSVAIYPAPRHVDDLWFTIIVAIGVVMMVLDDDAFALNDARALNVRFSFFISTKICGRCSLRRETGKGNNANREKDRPHGRALR